MSKKIKLSLFTMLVICFLLILIFFTCNGIEYHREVKAEKILTEYLESQNQSKYGDYMMAAVKTDRYIASLRLNQTIWVIFEDEPKYIYEYLLNSGDDLHLMQIKDMSNNTTLSEGNHGFSSDSKKYTGEPLNNTK